MPGTTIFKESFQNGLYEAPLSTTNTGFNSFVGSGTAIFTTDYGGVLSSSCVKLHSDGAVGTERYGVKSVASPSKIYFRFSIYLFRTPTSNVVLARAVSGASNAHFQLNAGGGMSLALNGSVVATVGSTPKLNQWNTIEWMIDTTLSQQNSRVYYGKRGNTYGALSGGGFSSPPTQVEFGLLLPTTETVLADEFELAYDDWLGEQTTAIVSNDYESSFTAGFVTINTINSGVKNNTSFDTTNTTFGFAEYDKNTYAHGLNGGFYQLDSSTGIVTSYSNSIGTKTAIYGRCCVYLQSYPSQDAAFINTLQANTTSWLCGITTTGAIRSFLPSGTTMTSSSSVVPLNTWFRVEFFIQCSSTGSAYSIVRYYDKMDSSIITEENVSTATYTTTSDMTQYRFGIMTLSNVTLSIRWFLDDIALTTNNWVGPPSPNGSEISWITA